MSLLEGKVAFVTGASSGMGAATARRFVQEGALVVLADRNIQDGTELAEELGPSARFITLDVSDEENWRDAVDETVRAFGPISVLMNNAGVGGTGYIEHTDPLMWEKNMSVNLLGPLFGMRAVAPSMREAGGGSIINVSSLQGLEADVGLLPYVASKFGVRGITKSAVIELGRDNIRVNTVCPGLIRTPMVSIVPSHFMGMIPLRQPSSDDRAGLPENVAALAAFLASDQSSNITGAEIPSDGAKSVRFPAQVQNYESDVAAFRDMIGTKDE